MSIQHTPGPWIARGQRGNRWDVFVVTGTSYRGVASMWFEPEAEANAHLIAAAPEMLEACIKALAAMEDPRRAERDGDCYPIPSILREAIAKAEGGTQT